MTLDQVIDLVIDLEPEVDLEFEIYDFVFSDHHAVGPHNVDAFIEGRKKRNQIIEDFLNNGWQIHKMIVCPPNVILIFSREKEEKETTSNE